MSAQAPSVEVAWEGGFRASTEVFLAWLGWRAWIVRVVGLLLAIWVVGTAGGAGPMIVGLIEGLVLLSVPEWTAAISWWMSRRLGRRFVSLIAATGIARRTEVTSWFYSWESFSRACRTRRYWILGAGRTLIVLPVSEFSPEDEVRFRTYLAAGGLLRQ
ncbi:YcxB family protein [Kribbella qitaiheensis]|uniref:YcxB family protein n=1 Tax=Kribbella qitaiheensis TaxID=1544730 RepID=A0A7G6X6C4_9ACTN|nr:YcxB family protein [Kribbella qitaiheensis]QNE21789.1 YcxB family protein [Kribbella qitaiheensis]